MQKSKNTNAGKNDKTGLTTFFHSGLNTRNRNYKN